MRCSACHWSRISWTEKNLKRCLEAYETSAGKQTQHGIQMTCSKCLQKGHTKRTCSNEIAIIPPKKPRGRPSKHQMSEEQSVETTPTLQSQPTPTLHTYI
ncbi:BnaAnng12010D [Brassica napus]|uniref:(rape) hypothetical protein n=1 Tax=Brassica napus TaxID=3708 RepID=A0A078IT18_BRANA|nr:unnamed protein product [Brassica napus]CDY53142.1 BnaAnng12010D [Brassica napus]